MLSVLRHLLKQDCLTHAASARLHRACRALAQVHVSCVDDEPAPRCFTMAVCSNGDIEQLHVRHMATANTDQRELNRGLQPDSRLPHAARRPCNVNLMLHAGRLGMRSFAAGSAASHGDEPQQSTGPSAAARAAPTGASASSAALDPDQQVSEDAAAAAETRELDEMLQRMTAEAEDMILGGHPQEAIQHLTEGEHVT